MSIEIRLLGRFEVLADGEPTGADAWRRKHAAALVKLLAITPGRTLHREQLLDLLWPELAVDEAAPRLHKAAHFARRGFPDGMSALVLRADTIALLPDGDVHIDAVAFEQAAADAIESGSVAAARAALELYVGTLLPQDVYEPWAEQMREQLTVLHQRLLRQAQRWEQLLTIDPADEQAHVELMRAHLKAGERTSVLRQFERMDRILRQELGIAPSAAAVELRDAALALLPTRTIPSQRSSEATGLVGRDPEVARLQGAMKQVANGRSCTVLLSGPPGAGKTALLGWVRTEAASRGWRTASGAAATVEGAWPYAPVLEALSDLCRSHPTLLDGLDDRYRAELERVLTLPIEPTEPGSGHQRLFVAAGALLGVAGAAPNGLVLLLDDIHEADDASLRLIHYLARTARDLPVLFVLAHREEATNAGFGEFVTSLRRRDTTVTLNVGALNRESCTALVGMVNPDLPMSAADRIWNLSGGLPFAITELASAATLSAGPAAIPDPRGWLTARLPAPTRDLLARVAVLGVEFSTDEFVAMSGFPDELAYARLESAISTRVIEPTGNGYRFRHPLVRERLLSDLPPHRRAGLHREAAGRLADLSASPRRIGHHLVAAGAVRDAVPHLLQAAKAESAVGAYRDALGLLDTIRHEAVGAPRAEIAVLRGELLATLGDLDAVEAFREGARLARGELRRRARAGMARAAVVFGDFATGAEALAGLELNGGPNDVAVLLARGTLAYFSGDMQTAAEAAERARTLIVTGDEGWQLLKLVSLQGLLAHNRGEWFERFSLELQQGRNAPQVAAAVFDSHLCVAEYLLYGPTPYARVIDLARSLRETAQRAGVLRAVGFASALLGEAALLSGDLDLAERELSEAADLHRDIGARAGEAHCLQRLAEVRLARGDRAAARRLCEQSIPLARWTPIAMHLLQRSYGTLIQASDDIASARDAVERAEATMSATDYCPFCAVMLSVPAAIACADANDVPAALRHLDAAYRSAQLWEGTAWQGGIREAEAHVAHARGEADEASRLIQEAERIFAAAGQPIDANRCRKGLPAPVPEAVAAVAGPAATPSRR